MVRLVFRPYTQIWWSICTSESLRASTRVSPGFALLRHSSPSFGSQHVCSHSDLSPEGCWPADSAPEGSYHCYFHYAYQFATDVLAHMLDSLVRVSRRGKEIHFLIHHEHRVTDLSPTQDMKSEHSLRRVVYSQNVCPRSSPELVQLTTAPKPQVAWEEWRRFTLDSFASLLTISGTL